MGGDGIRPSIRMTPRLCRAARAMLGWQQRDLVAASGVAISTLGAFEVKGEDARLANMNNRALVETFERAGLQFLLPDDQGGHGLRLRVA